MEKLTTIQTKVDALIIQNKCEVVVISQQYVSSNIALNIAQINTTNAGVPKNNYIINL